jgi:uncharacterized Ntn-hydrolase superfamily protein
MTYSLVAFDPDTGECGVAVQSHWFSVGGVVSWAEPGVGAVATQAVVEVPHGPGGLKLMREGLSAPEALERRIEGDPNAAARQLAMVDVRGGVAAYTGSGCMAHAGQVVGHHHSCQANLMETDAVWGAMSEAYLGTAGPLADRLLAALDAAEAAGGDRRGRQSAAMLVVPAQGEPWQRTVDLRVEDHAEPLLELRRLLALNESYGLVRAGDDLALEGDNAAAADAYIAAWELTPESHELKFWAALALVERGEGDRGVTLLREAIEDHPGWEHMLEHLTTDMVPGADEVRRLFAAQEAGGGVGPT